MNLMGSGGFHWVRENEGWIRAIIASLDIKGSAHLLYLRKSLPGHERIFSNH